MKPFDFNNDTEVLILVLNRPFSYFQRNNIREDFHNQCNKLNDLKYKYKLLFLIGLNAKYEERFDKIFNESSKCNDLIIQKREDTYTSTSLKMLSSLYWISQIHQNSKLKWIVKIDDDVLLNVKKLDSYLDTVIKNESTERIHCRVYYGIKPMRNGIW